MFPDFLDGAKVLEYTEPGHFGFITDYDEAGNPMEREIRYLALCAYTGEDNLYLFYCDEDFDVISDFCGDTLTGFKDSCPRAVWLEKHPPTSTPPLSRRPWAEPAILNFSGDATGVNTGWTAPCICTWISLST